MNSHSALGFRHASHRKPISYSKCLFGDVKYAPTRQAEYFHQHKLNPAIPECLAFEKAWSITIHMLGGRSVGKAGPKS
jgi:hypothetical protein